MPPPLPSQNAAPVPPVPEPIAASGTVEQRSNEEQELAIRLIRVMVAAAHADGRLDEQEEQRILEKLQEQGLSREERLFLLQELHAPKGIAELTAGLNGPMIAQTMYSLAVSTIVVDTVEERQWLDRLAAALSLSPAMSAGWQYRPTGIVISVERDCRSHREPSLRRHCWSRRSAALLRGFSRPAARTAVIAARRGPDRAGLRRRSLRRRRSLI